MRLRDIFWIIDTKNSRALITKWAEKAGMDAEQLISYVEENYKETADQLAVAKWIIEGNGSYDRKTCEQALYICKQKKLDPLKQNPKELVQQYPDVKPKEKPINPDDVLTDRKDEGDGVVTYVARDEDRKVLRQIINTHFGKNTSPWCLLQGDDEGNLRNDSERYWEHYSAYPKRVAFKDGKLLAFSAGTNKEMREWWDRFDRSFPFIPYEGKQWEGSNGVVYEVGKRGNVYRVGGSLKQRLSQTYTTNIESADSEVTIDTKNHTIMTQGGDIVPYEEKDGHYITTEDYWRSGDERVVKSYNKELELDGEYKKYNGDKLILLNTFKNNVKEGPHRRYSSDGVLLDEGTYKNGEKSGLWKHYYGNGDIKIIAEYANGKCNGVVEEYYDGYLESRVTYKNGNVEGPFELYYDNGKLKSKGTNQGDGYEGWYEEYYESGQLRKKLFYKNNRMEGTGYTYYENGQLKNQAEYKDGKLEGPCIIYNSDGSVKSEGTFKNGMIDKWKDYQ